MSTGIYLRTRDQRDLFINEHVANNGFIEIKDKSLIPLKRRLENLTTTEALREAAVTMLGLKQDFGQIICPLKKTVMSHKTGEQVHYLMNAHKVESGRSDFERSLKALNKSLKDLLSAESVDQNAVDVAKNEIAQLTEKIAYLTKLLDLPRIDTGIPGMVAFCTTN